MSIFKKEQLEEFYNAFINKDSKYEGIFFAGIKTTGIFCRPTCSARKPKRNHCEFFQTTKEALSAGYRPCKRCTPFQVPGAPSEVIKKLISAVEADPSRKWQDSDLKVMNIDPSTARRQFKKRFGMTFISYARKKRLNIAIQTIDDGDKVIYAQIDSSYESGSGFREAFTKAIGQPPSKKSSKILKANWIDTPLGTMLCLADETHLHLLEFTDCEKLESKTNKLRGEYGYAIMPGTNTIIDILKNELNDYFIGNLHNFKTPVKIYGSEFQVSTMNKLKDIPYGQTISYLDQAKEMGQEKSVRAISKANGMNQLVIIIPCHRVIGKDGQLKGYSGGLARKKWLLDHELKFKNKKPTK